MKIDVSSPGRLAGFKEGDFLVQGTVRADKDRAIATVNAIEGAIQDCQYWLQQVSEQSEQEE